MEEKWKSSKKEASTSLTRSCSTKNSSTLSSKAPLFMRSSSLKIFSSSSPKCPDLPSSSSIKTSPPKGSHSSFTRSFSQKGSSITRKAKEQKARFYIMRRCVAMLVCWHKHGDP